MPEYTSQGQPLIQSSDVPFVNEYGRVVASDRPVLPVGGTSEPGGGGTPTLSLSAYELTFSSKTNGPNPPSQIVELTNSGTGTISSFTVSNTADWLVISPLSGAAPSTLTFSVLNSGLTAGWYVGNVTITASGALGSPALVHVVLTVEADATLPTVEPINKKAWLAYYKTATLNGEYTTTACTGTANGCIVSRNGDFGSDPNLYSWADRQRNAATQIAALGGKIFIGTSEEEILNMKSQWSTVGGIGAAEYSAATDIPGIEAEIAATRAILAREELESRPFFVYMDSSKVSTLTRWISGMDWIVVGVYLTYIAGESATAVRSRAATIISNSVTTIKALKTGPKIILAAQAFDRGTGGEPEWTVPELEYLQKAYPDALRAYPEITGIFWFCYDRYDPNPPNPHNRGTMGYPTLIPWHKATKQAILGIPDPEVPPSGPQGTLLVCDTSTISGTAYDANYPNQSVFVQIFDGPGVLGVNTNRIGQLTTNASTYAFSTATPASVLDGAAHSVHVYAVSKSSPVYQVQLLNSPKTVQLAGGSTGMTTSGRSFLYKGSQFTWKGVTCFMAIKILLDGGSMNSKLDYWESKGVNILRVFGMIGGEGIWAGWGFNPQTAGYYTAWNTLLTAAASRNLVVEACVMADTSVIPPYNTQDGRKALITQFTTTLAAHKNFVIELCNEPWHPYNSNMTVQNMVELAQLVKTADSNRLVTFGASDGDDNTSLNVSPTSYLVIHSDRDTSPKWDWVTTLFDPTNPNVAQSTIPLVDNEPINSTSSTSSQVDPDSARWYAYALACQLRQVSSTYHYGDGKYTYLPSGAAITCLDSWLAGRNQVSWTWGGSYFYGFHPTSADSPFYSTGTEILCLGRRSAGNVVALVVAPPDWVPSLRPGCTYTTPYTIADSDNAYKAYYVTVTFV
jgi:hypothetical protein